MDNDIKDEIIWQMKYVYLMIIVHIGIEGNVKVRNGE